MKVIPLCGLAVFLLTVTASINGWAQAGAAASAPVASAVAASGDMSAPSSRKADRALRRKVYAAIAKHKEISAGDISVRAKNGVVTLNGTSADASQVDRIAEIARGVPDVTSVINKLTVQKPLGGM
ncbi:BON domain-containing protein [Paraburkholderia sp. DHOC27]|uniref:BON domain-containing protein n=1 Tax=Paraburkholderia sp. DHOC27 TaxID=2303330 RepID=UPI000E3D7EFF|nr:BON domain-containing protein [Paraburkholderia sp. DHOC27]RFU49558.1 BON domain-containing protein [Paraburkholderia sp. DHOC27]